jgi:hypothetical protein
MGEALLAVLLGKGRIGSLATPSSGSRFLFSPHMDKIFVDQALQAYRDKTGDTRSWDSLPIDIVSGILREAQRLKSFRSGKFPQSAAADGCVDS